MHSKKPIQPGFAPRNSSPLPSILIAGGLVLAVSATAFMVACNVKTLGGYRFDYRGEKETRIESGLIDSQVESIVVDNRFGDVQIQVTDSEPSWEWQISCWANEIEDAKLFTEQAKLDTSLNGQNKKWIVALPESDSKLRGVQSNLVFKVPAELNVEITNRHGDIVASNLGGKTKIDNGFGKIKLRNLTGDCDVSNRHGETSIKTVNGNLKVKSSFGEIEVGNVAGAVEISNQHDDILVYSVSAGVQLTNAFGDIEARGISGDIKAFTRHGDIELQTGDAGIPAIRAECSFGDIEIDLPGAMQPRFDLSIKFGEIENEFADNPSNEPLIKLSNSHGDIKIRKSN